MNHCKEISRLKERLKVPSFYNKLLNSEWDESPPAGYEKKRASFRQSGFAHFFFFFSFFLHRLVSGCLRVGEIKTGALNNLEFICSVKQAGSFKYIFHTAWQWSDPAHDADWLIVHLSPRPLIFNNQETNVSHNIITSFNLVRWTVGWKGQGQHICL